MINKEIIINKKTRAIINGENGDLFRLGVDGENLQENIVFKFDDEFVNGTARIEITMQDNTKSYIMTTKVNETYVLPVKSIITKTGLNKMQLVITQGTNDEEIPIFKSKMFSFFIAESINADTEQPEGYPQWIDKANTKLNEIDNFDIDAIKELNEATITITDRYGISKSVQVFDGENGKDAKINGVNTLRMVAGENITIEQEDDTLTINSQGGGGSGAVTSVNGQTGDVVIEIPDVSNFITKDVNNLTYYESKATTANNLVASIDSSTYVMTLTLRNSSNETLNSQTIDLPLETMVVSGSYDSQTKKIILTLKNGNTIEFSVADLVSGLQSEITSNNKLSADLVDDTSTTNKFTNATEKATWNAKSDFSGNYTDLTNKPNLDIYDVKVKTNDSNNYFNFNTEELGTYILNTTSANFYYIIGENRTSYPGGHIFLLKYIKKASEATQNEKIGIIIFMTNGTNADKGQLYLGDMLFSNNQIYYSNTSAIGGMMASLRMITNMGQNIDGKKVFTTTPQLSSYSTPSNNTDLVAKKYVDDQVATKTIQYSTMPTASNDYLDKIVQFIGTTDSTYTNGYFYKCVSDGESTPTYSWEQIDIQAPPKAFYLGNATDYTAQNPLNVSNLEVGLYCFNVSSTSDIIYVSGKVNNIDFTGTLDVGTNDSTYSSNYVAYMKINTKISECTPTYSGTSVGVFYFNTTRASNETITYWTKTIKISTNSAGTEILISNSGSSMFNLKVVTQNDNQTITGRKTFSTLPETSIVPTENYHIVNKKYVDDSITNKFWIGTQIEYDAITTKDANVLYFIQEV